MSLSAEFCEKALGGFVGVRERLGSYDLMHGFEILGDKLQRASQLMREFLLLLQDMLEQVLNCPE